MPSSSLTDADTENTSSANCGKDKADNIELELFKDNTENPECPVCMMPFPFDITHVMFQGCCGQRICKGCNHAQRKEDIKNGKEGKDVGVCAFCRTPRPETAKAFVKLLNKRVKQNDAYSIYMLASYYEDGDMGFPKNMTKAIDLYLKAGELGCSHAYDALGNAFYYGGGIEKDVNKARKYYELGVVGGDVSARHNLGSLYWYSGDRQKASKHFMLGAKAGCEKSLINVKKAYQEGYVTKDEYMEALLSYQKRYEDTKSAMRKEALLYEANPSLYWEKC